MQMSSKNRQEKTKSPKKRVSSSVVAEVVGCAPCTVTQVLSGVRNSDTELGQKIQIANMVLEEGIESVIVKAKKTLSN